jgi:beta-galactosidase
VAQIGNELQQLAPDVVGSRVQARVALLMDWQNWWAVEYLPGPSDRLHYWELLKSYYRALHQRNIAVDVVQPDSDLSGYRLLIAPLLHLLRPGVAQNLEQFVQSGGNLLTTFFSGIVDQYDHIHLGGYPGELRRLLGIHVEEFDPWTNAMTNAVVIEEGPLKGLYPCSLWGELVRLEGASAPGVFASDYYAGEPALTVNQFGQGKAYYLATQPDNDLLDGLTKLLIQEAGVSPVLEAPRGVEVTKRVRSDGRAIYFLLNHSDQPQQVTLPAGMFTSLLNRSDVNGQVALAPKDVTLLLENGA